VLQNLYMQMGMRIIAGVGLNHTLCII
jgi:hypothetical protein